MAFSKIILTGSTNGRGISITGILPSTANLVHTAITGAGTEMDEVYVYVVNTATKTLEARVRWAVTAANATDINDRNIQVSVTQGSGPVLVVPGWPLRDANRVEAYATVAGTATGGIVVYGYANRIT
jgi:hypothetical protein